MKEKEVVAITMLGNCTVTYEGQTLRDVDSVRENLSWNLLEYLVWNRERSIRPEELAAAFDAPAGEMSGNTCRVRLHRSRTLLEKVGLGHVRNGLLLYRKACISLNPQYSIESDTEQVEADYASLFDEKLSETDKLSRAMHAISQYEGKFLQNAQEQPWIVTLREHYNRLFAELAENAIRLMKKTGDYSQAEVLGRKMLLICPVNMELHLRLISALIRGKMIGEAVNQYTGLAVRLAHTDLMLPDFRELLA